MRSECLPRHPAVAYLCLVRSRSRIVTATAPHIRFREAREPLGLSPDELAAKSGVSDAGIWDIEAFEGDLTCCYSPADVRKFCRVLGIRPAELFGSEISEPPVSPRELERLIHEECRLRGVTLEQFEDAVGWRLSACIEPPERLLQDMTVDGLQWLCRELRIDWRRAI
jgi:transcriptional regulator with XRE-family HTH domain